MRTGLGFLAELCVCLREALLESNRDVLTVAVGTTEGEGKGKGKGGQE